MNEMGLNEKLIIRNRRKRDIIRILILLLFLISLTLFFSKKNILLTEFSLKGEPVETMYINEKYEEKGYIAKSYIFDISKSVKVKSNVDPSKYGEYKVTYTIRNKFLNMNKTLERVVKVIDNVPPVLTVESKDYVKSNLYEEYNIPSYNATDNMDGDITDKVKIDNNINNSVEGEYKISFEIEDSSGNKVKKNITVLVEPKYKHSKIVVDKGDQMMYYYEDDELIFASDVVTGYGYDTPLGEYYINNKLYSAHLKGDDYETDVNYWMAFIGSSHGFHSAPWRSSFGGNIYLYNPSHGCINLPTWAARELYNLADVGTPVYIVE